MTILSDISGIFNSYKVSPLGSENIGKNDKVFGNEACVFFFENIRLQIIKDRGEIIITLSKKNNEKTQFLIDDVYKMLNSHFKYEFLSINEYIEHFSKHFIEINKLFNSENYDQTCAELDAIINARLAF